MSEPQAVTPYDESSRLRELLSLDVLDTQPEERFDRYTRLVADVFDVPTTLVSLVDRERQWFKSIVGLDACQTSRDVAFCDHALSTDLLEVPDARLDERFCDNPLVTEEPNIRFYAGAVLRGPTRQPIGTLCIIDYQPRRLTEDERRRLLAFAKLVEDELNFSNRLEHTREDLQRLALRDTVTGLPGPLLLEERIDQALVNAKAVGRTVAVVHIRLPHFEAFNSSHSWEAGNRLLAELGARLAQHSDEAGMAARLSGPRYAVLLPMLNDRADASRKVRHLLQAVAAPFKTQRTTERPPMAVGVSLFPEDADSRRQLLDRARLAARASLAGNALDFHFYSQETDEWAMRRHRMAQRLGEAVRTDAVQPVYQPIYCVRRGVVAGCEVLARWHDSELGTVSPAEFIPLAEDEPALIHALTVAILSRSCRQALAWDDAGAPPSRVSVNFSGQTLYRDDFPELVLRVLAKEGFPPSRLTVELTEQSIISNVAMAAQNMEALRQHGVRFAVDDFGTGYSSLGYLRRLPIDVVKIDRSFMEDIATDPVARDLTRGILDIARTLGLKAVAEGIEHPEQLEVLRELDCDLAQGFLLAKPMPGDDVPALLAPREYPCSALNQAQRREYG